MHSCTRTHTHTHTHVPVKDRPVHGRSSHIHPYMNTHTHTHPQLPVKDRCTVMQDTAGEFGTVWHQELERLHSSRNSGSAVVRDEEPGEALDASRRANAVFITQGMLLGAISLIDLVSATVLQIFWGDADFLCVQRLGSPQGDTCNVFDGYRPNHLTLIALIIGAYTFLLFLGVWDMTSKGMSMIRSTEQQRWWDRAWRTLIALILAASLIVLVLHVQLCKSENNAFTTENLWQTNVLRRVHTVLHFMRGFSIIATCIGLQQVRMLVCMHACMCAPVQHSGDVYRPATGTCACMYIHTHIYVCVCMYTGGESQKCNADHFAADNLAADQFAADNFAADNFAADNFADAGA
jgi:hypothetical protein